MIVFTTDINILTKTYELFSVHADTYEIIISSLTIDEENFLMDLSHDDVKRVKPVTRSLIDFV